MTDLPYRPCVGVVLVNQNGNIFVGERLDTPGAWQMPQGGVDDGETLEAAAFRELTEETGVKPEQVAIAGQTSDWVTYDLPDHLIGKVWGGAYRGQKQQWFLMRYKGTDAGISLDHHCQEFRRWKWSDPATVVREIVPFKQAVYQAVLTELLAWAPK